MTERDPKTGETIMGHFVSLATFKTHERADKQWDLRESTPSTEDAIVVQTLLHPGHTDATVSTPCNNRKGKSVV